MAKRLLLDTCSAVWFGFGSDSLSLAAKEALVKGENKVFLSAASVWEISVKWSLGKLALPVGPGEFIPRLVSGLRLTELPIGFEEALLAETLPWRHRDPFDRMLICQAMRHGLTIVTPDPVIHEYDIPTLW